MEALTNTMEGQDPLLLAFMASVITWLATAAGAGVIMLRTGVGSSLLRQSFGLSSGVMLAASFFSLLLPALKSAQSLGYRFAWLPVVVGFLLGGAFVKMMEFVVPHNPSSGIFSFFVKSSAGHQSLPETRETDEGVVAGGGGGGSRRLPPPSPLSRSWFSLSGMRLPKNMFILVVAVTIHNVFEGVALGVAFGSLQTGGDLHDAIVLTIALSLQNIPEGFSISTPIRKAGLSLGTSFFYGQLSGAVEIIGSVLGCMLVVRMQSILPYALSFAAGAMIYVVCNDLIPNSMALTPSSSPSLSSDGEGSNSGGTAGLMIGFAVMMALDTAFEEL
eukprot:TRINITY_DN305_c1_g3_i1.p1 TRINITY_DN305_c1_g3~~TRINITY_DN305_c1_g3_i1.p1  ORF type:complete len:331 (-),score=68.17 TRINITY_DN305_c1_g3_i1:34-1026(-)